MEALILAGIIAIAFVVLLLPLLIIHLLSKAIETRHLKSIEEREERFSHIAVNNLRRLPADTQVEASNLCLGHMVISNGLVRQMLAGIRAMFGGEVKSFEHTLMRGRREAVLRMKRHAASMGCDMIVNVRYEAFLMESRNQNNAISAIELLVYGTAVRRKSASRAPHA